MLKFYCFLTGDDYSLLSTDTPKSKQKVMLMGAAMMLPVIIWAINGYLLTNKVLQDTVGISLLVAGVCAFLIFLVERIIVMASADKGVKNFRMVIGTCTALLGALALDEVVFKKDIDHQIEVNKKAYASKQAIAEGRSFETTYQLAEKSQSIKQSKVEYNNLEATALKEMDGYGSGTKGVGKIARQKLALTDDRKDELTGEKKAYDSLLNLKGKVIEEAKANAMAEYGDGLMVRIGALFQLVFSDWVMFITYLGFTILMFCLEFIVVFVKMKMPESNYERRLKLIEDIGQRRMEMLSSQGSPLVEGDYCLPNALAARKTLNKNSNSLYN